ncbi:MAG TPA: hypothetical protein VF283_16935 [Bryobacteraceae bacterium]
MHVRIDPPPHVLEDEIGLQLAAPGDGRRDRPDMDAHATRFFRASIVAGARFIEDVVVEPAGRGVSQCVSKERAAAGDSILESTRDRNRCYRPFRAFP